MNSTESPLNATASSLRLCESFISSIVDPVVTVYIVILFFITGVCSNGLVITLVYKEKTLRKPTFIAIALLSLTDIVFIVFQGAKFLLIYYLGWHYPMVAKLTIEFLRHVSDFSAAWHLLLLALLRMCILTHPLKSRICLRTRKVRIVSILIWLVAVFMTIPYLVMRVRQQQALLKSGATSTEEPVVNSNNSIQQPTCETEPRASFTLYGHVYQIISCLLPIVLIIGLQVFKLIYIRQVSLQISERHAVNTVKVIIVLYIICLLPARLLHSLLDFDVYPDDAYYVEVVDAFCNLFSFGQRSINPVCFAFLSKPFRDRIKARLCRKPVKLSDFNMDGMY